MLMFWVSAKERFACTEYILSPIIELVLIHKITDQDFFLIFLIKSMRVLIKNKELYAILFKITGV